MDVPVDANLNPIEREIEHFDRRQHLADALELHSAVLAAIGHAEEAANAADEARSLRRGAR
jgi:hypothetical protein